MNIDYLNEIKYQLHLFNCILRKKYVNVADINDMIIILADIIDYLEYYRDHFE